MSRILPGLALLLLLGGAGLGFGYMILAAILDQTQVAAIPGLFEQIQRLRAILDLLVFSLGGSFGLLGVGLWMQRPTGQQPDWERRLARLMQTLDAEQKEHLLRLEASLTAWQARIKKEEVEAKPPESPILPPVEQNALVPQGAPVPHPSFHQQEETSSRRLAITAQGVTHDKQDEEFEPF